MLWKVQTKLSSAGVLWVTETVTETYIALAKSESYILFIQNFYLAATFFFIYNTICPNFRCGSNNCSGSGFDSTDDCCIWISVVDKIYEQWLAWLDLENICSPVEETDVMLYIFLKVESWLFYKCKILRKENF